LIRLETPLKTIDDWYEWAARLNHKHHKLNQAIKQMRGTLTKEKTRQKKYYFPWRERDPNAMDVDRLTINEQNKLMKEGRCFKCRTPDTGLTNALQMKMTRSKRLRKSLERR
jgi:uncharacterized protein with WD repeat